MPNSIPRPQRKRWYKRWWIWTLLVLVVVIIGGGVAIQKAMQAQQLESFAYLEDNVLVKIRDVRKTISTSGTITPDAQVQLAPTVTGVVTEVPVRVGQDVSEGDTLILIDPDLPGGTKALEATFEGRVIAVNTFVGDRVTPAVPIVQVAYRTNHIEFYASDTEALELEDGQLVDITVPSYENGKTTYTGQILSVDVKKQIAMTALGQSGFLVKVSTGNLPQTVTSAIGLTVDMTIITAQKNGIPSVENAAIQYADGNEAFVYLPVTVDDAFVARVRGTEDVASFLTKKAVTVGFAGDEYTEVTSGVAVGDSVLFYVPAQSTSSGL